MRNRQASYFKGFGDNNPRSVSLYDFVTTNKFQSLVERIRDTSDPNTITELKQALPFITPACICKGGHGVDNIVSRNGFVSIDFDNGSKNNKNTQIQGSAQWSEFILSLRNFSNIFYAGLSASGKGGFAIIPLMYPDKFLESFLGIQYTFKKEFGIEIEKGCHNVNRLRFVSFNVLDQTSFVNQEVTDWRFLIQPEPVKIGGAAKIDGTPSIAYFRSLARHIETRENNPQSFANGSRHAFTITLAGACAWAGIPVEQCVEWISDEYWSKEPDYISRIDSEIRGIDDAYIYAGKVGRAKVE